MMSGTRKPKVGFSGKRVVIGTTAFAAKNPGAVMSTVPLVAGRAGSSTDSVPEKPLPNWAV